VPPPVPELLRFKCPCGAALKIPASQVDGHGRCSRCRRRLLLSGKTGTGGKLVIHPLVLDDSKRSSGRTFLIEDHFKEVPAPQDKVGFRCPCGRQLFARPDMVDKRGKCPECGARLLLVGKTHPRTRKLEFHPLILEEASSGDTMMIDGLS
jgi:DNA-directed RNA polymerase subunit RPC12/RpoP